MPARVRRRSPSRPRPGLRTALVGWGVAALLAAGVAGVLGAIGQSPAFASGQPRGGVSLSDLDLRTPAGLPANATADGRVTVVFFGFTRCPDYCPGVLQRWRQVRQALGPQADALQLLFVTLDPVHDTGQVLSEYLGYFDQDFIGMTGSDTELADAAARLGAVYREADGNAAAALDHSSLSYLFDGSGRLRLAVAPDARSDAMLRDVRALLAAGADG